MRLARHLTWWRDDADGVHVILGWIADGGYCCWFVVALLLLMWLDFGYWLFHLIVVY